MAPVELDALFDLFDGAPHEFKRTLTMASFVVRGGLELIFCAAECVERRLHMRLVSMCHGQGNDEVRSECRGDGEKSEATRFLCFWVHIVHLLLLVILALFAKKFQKLLQ